MGITLEDAIREKKPILKKRFHALTGDGGGSDKPVKKGLSTGAMWTIGVLVTGVVIGVYLFIKKRGSLGGGAKGGFMEDAV